jgi:hypothetical protein
MNFHLSKNPYWSDNIQLSTVVRPADILSRYYIGIVDHFAMMEYFGRGANDSNPVKTDKIISEQLI